MSSGQLFPEELWEVILEKLAKSSPPDLLNVCRASPMFERIACPTKTSWLFELIVPLIVPYLDQHNLLHCRIICNSWKQGVDRFLQSRASDPSDVNTPLESYSLATTDSQSRATFVSNAFTPKFCNLTTLDCFIHDFDANITGFQHGNPFPSRSIMMGYDYQEFQDNIYNSREGRLRNELASYLLNRFLQDCVHFATLYGEYLYHLKLSVTYPEGYICNSSMHNHQFLHDILQSTPNLKSLQVHIDQVDESHEYLELPDNLPLLPQLPHLTHLHFDATTQFGIKPIEALFSIYAATLHKLTLTGSPTTFPSVHLFGRMTNLQEITLLDVHWTPLQLQRLFSAVAPSSPNLHKVNITLALPLPLLQLLICMAPLSDQLKEIIIFYKQSSSSTSESTNNTTVSPKPRFGILFGKLRKLHVSNPLPNTKYEDLLKMIPYPKRLQHNLRC